jgi:signal transduction histidine kinase
MSKIENRMDQLLDLINDIRQLSQIKAGHPLSEIAIYDLTEETGKTCEQYREDAEAKGLSMRVNLPEIPVFVRIDQSGYDLILSNLVSNAVKYTPSGSVTVGLLREDPWAVLEVADTGMGIPEADIPRLFSEFFRASNARRNQVPGSGVGLAGVKELVERFRGELTFDSKENEGSTFRVRLPIQEA